MHFANQPPKKKKLNTRENDIELMSLIADEKTLTQAASKLGTTTSTAITLARDFVNAVLDGRRWGWNHEVRSAFEKKLHVIFSEHYEFLAEVVVKFKIEMQYGSFQQWQESLCKLERKLRMKKTCVKALTWTAAVDSRLGPPDEKIEKELDSLSSLVRKRRMVLGVIFFKSATMGAKTKNTSAHRSFSSNTLMQSVWSAPLSSNKSAS